MTDPWNMPYNEQFELEPQLEGWRLDTIDLRPELWSRTGQTAAFLEHSVLLTGRSRSRAA